ncbi:MAG: S41 family peptidase [Patescibacteria group bacterium]
MKKLNFRKFVKIILFTAIILVLSFFAFEQGYEQAEAQEPFLSTGDFTSKHFKVFWDTWDRIKSDYVDKEKINNDKAAFEAARGLVRSLDDPYSDLYEKKKAKVFEDDLQGEFGGVGMEISEKKGLVTVVAPLEGTPADKAGIKAGDIIMKIDGEDATNITVEEAVQKIRGKVGTKVVLTLMREGWKDTKDFTVIRGNIEVPAVKSEFYKPNIGYININTFNPKTVSEFTSAYNKLKKQGARKFILDLRNNPGGYLEIAVKLSEFFLKKGQVVVKEKWGGAVNSDKTEISKGPGNLKKLRMVVLVNKGSASASEIFAGALRDNLGTKILGEKSYGKGSIQQMFQIDDNLLKLTVGYWFTPKGLKLEGKGIEPDIKLEDKTPDDGVDDVLNQTIQYIKKH